MRLLVTVLAVIFLLLSCSSQPKVLSLPLLTEGGWKQKSSGPLDPSKRPEWMERLGLKDARQAQYSGPIDLEVFLFQMSSSAAALECTQLWKKSPSDSVMMKDNYFFVFRTEHPNREMLMDFTRAFEKTL
jgi:hypothetical protein